MKSRILFCCLASLILTLCLAVSANAAEAVVVQGKCISYDKEKKSVTIEEYNTDFTKSKYGEPTGKQSTYNLSTALIGIAPAPGDIVRIAYDEKEGARVGIRLMNVSRQDLMSK